MQFAKAQRNSYEIYAGSRQITTSANNSIGTTGPGTKLQVSSTYTYGSATNDVISIKPTLSGGTSSNPSSLGGIVWNDLSGSSSTARINVVADDLSGTSQNHMEFWTGGSAGAVSEKMRITTAGNVGIGTTTPNLKLDVEDDIQIGTGTTGCVKADISVLKDEVQKLKISMGGDK